MAAKPRRTARRKQAKRPESTNVQLAADAPRTLTLLFIDADDVHEPWGKLQFGANSLRLIDKARGLPQMRVRGVVPERDGSWTVYGHRQEGPLGPQGTWSMLRARTWDGVQYEQAETVFTAPPRHWYGEYCICHRPGDGRLLCFKWGRSPEGKGHGMWVFASDDGRSWELLADDPVYHDHDAFSVIWDEPSGQYVNFQHTYQEWDKPFRDNAGPDIRRVLHIRTSPDGLHWKPSGDASLRGPKMPKAALMAPDAEDPPEDEFYLFVGFPWHGRYVGMMKHYLPSPPPAVAAGWHGPHNNGEWWVARDFRKWQRPFRNVFAPGQASDVILHPPMVIGGQNLWIIGGNVYGLPAYRLFYAGSLSNSRFATPPFTAPAAHLFADAEFNFHADPSRGFQGQSYLMVEALDAAGNVIPGYEREKCRFFEEVGRGQLLWRDGEAVRQIYDLRGQTIRLRFHMRDARLYAVHT